jgi:hypothetical protein
MTLPEAPAEFVEALNDAAAEYGVNLSVSDRVAIARRLAALPVGTVRATLVTEAFLKQGLRRPPAGYSTTVVSRIEAMGGTRSLEDVLLSFRRWAIDALSSEFGAGRSKAREESLRNHLRGYLTTHAEVEGRTGRGKTDIYIPELDTVIEVKVWTNRSTYDEGVEELGRYIHTKQPRAAFMVVFGDRDPLPGIVVSHRRPFAESLNLEGLTVPVIVVPFEGVAPSKALRASNRRSRCGR